MSDFPRFQYSYFLDNGDQIVVRGSAVEEWAAEVAEAQAKYPKPNSVNPVVHSQTPTNGVQKHVVRKDYCNLHNKEMKERISKAGRPYNAHYKKTGEDWDTCFGKGWVSEQEGVSSEEVGRQWQ